MTGMKSRYVENNKVENGFKSKRFMEKIKNRRSKRVTLIKVKNKTILERSSKTMSHFKTLKSI